MNVFYVVHSAVSFHKPYSVCLPVSCSIPALILQEGQLHDQGGDQGISGEQENLAGCGRSGNRQVSASLPYTLTPDITTMICSQHVFLSSPGISQSRISLWLNQQGSDLSEQKKRAFVRWYQLEKTNPGDYSRFSTSNPLTAGLH